ncbi:fungal specific transcription factor domain-containing protein [Aspergillus lucknowensis]|uniref:Xylanolytic transcriptional activator regulatory domain-containing protein n=1 Tax=Aspergillus lucknowensis TaxID=176173 RepID=A0ABR4LWM9_9EURO
MTATHALTHLCPTYVRDEADDRVDENARPVEQVNTSEGPLLDLLQRALLVESTAHSPAQPQSTLTQSEQTIQSLRALRLHPNDLHCVLELTKKYWPLWPVLPPGFVQVVHSSQGPDIRSATRFVNDSFDSQSSEIVAKGVLWLALCIQQLPSSFDSRQNHLPCPRRVLLDAYMKGAEVLLGNPYDTQKGITFLECLMLQCKLCVNMAKPRKAWLTFRCAINSALLQGLATEKMNSIWMQIWVFDRQLSMVLGLPYSVPDSHPRMLTLPNDDPHARILRHMGVIAGRIADRNLNIAALDYSMTLDIERDHFTMREMMPIEWDLPNCADLSVAEVFTKQVGKFYYNFLLKNIHFPYMLRGPADGDPYTHSRSTSLTAARAMIEHYHGLRYCSQGQLLICDLMDFQVFTAAIVLVIHLISPTDARDIQQDKADWAEINHLRQTLNQLSRAMECAVARQAADLLGYLYAAAHGRYDGDEPYKAVIPYFGEVRIRQGQGIPPTQSRSGTDTAPSSSRYNAIEFRTQQFSPQGPDTMGFQFGEGELCVDWSTVSGLDFDWDWSEVFTIPM